LVSAPLYYIKISIQPADDLRHQTCARKVKTMARAARYHGARASGKKNVEKP
jgi:hypothetical protein